MIHEKRKFSRLQIGIFIPGKKNEKDKKQKHDFQQGKQREFEVESLYLEIVKDECVRNDNILSSRIYFMFSQ